jgi:hypothetical protein
MPWITVMGYMCHNYHGEVPLVVTTSRSFPHSWFIIGFVTIVTHDGFHQWSRNCLPFRNTCVYPWCFSGVRVIWSLVLSVMFCRSLFVLLSFLFWPCVVFSVLLRFTDSDYRLSVNKLFNIRNNIIVISSVTLIQSKNKSSYYCPYMIYII